MLPAPVAADAGPCIMSPEVCATIEEGYRRYEERLGAGERAVRDLVDPVAPSCTASVDSYAARSSLVFYVRTGQEAQLTEYGVTGTNNGTCPAEQHEPPASPEGTAICNVFVFGEVGFAAGSDGDVDGNCFATATTMEVPFMATYAVEGYTFGDSGVLPGHDVDFFSVDCLPDECVEAR